MVGGEPPGPAERNRVLIPTHGRMPERPPSSHIWDFAGETMGTTWSVRLVPVPAQERDLYQAAIEDELTGLIALFSHWEPTSELSRFNTAEPGFHAVSEEFWTVLNAAMDIADDTNGAVDPTLGAIVDLWGFGPPGARSLTSAEPSTGEIDAARAVSGWGRLRLDRANRSILQLGGLKLDLSGIAKGHAVDCVSDRLFELGATSHLVEIGGELRGRGVKPDARPWWTELQQPPGSAAPRTLAALFDMAVATSGDWVRNYEVDGRNYSHTIDGRTGAPIDNGVASVTVLADTALQADALATALTVMGVEEGLGFATVTNLAAAIVIRTKDGLVETVSPAFAAMLDEGA